MKTCIPLFVLFAFLSACKGNMERSLSGKWESLGVMPYNKTIDSNNAMDFGLANLGFGSKTFVFQSDSLFGDGKLQALYKLNRNVMMVSAVSGNEHDTFDLKISNDTLSLINRPGFYAYVFKRMSS